MKRKILFSILAVLTVINILFFIYRDHSRYQSYASYKSLYSTCDAGCGKKWKKYVLGFPSSELAAAKLLTDSIIKDEKNSLEKITRIGHFLYSRFHNRLGNPSTDLLSSSPLDQYHKLCTRDSLELWCNNFAQMFSWFCWSQGIICRNIEIMNPGDHHVLNECYLPEQKKWMVVDLTNNLLALELNGKPVNLLDTRDAVKNSISLQAIRSSGDTMVTASLGSKEGFFEAYYKKDIPLYFYHSMNYTKVQRPGYKLRSYLLPLSWYDIYLPGGGSNAGFYTRLLFIVLWIAAFFVFLGSRKKFKHD